MKNENNLIFENYTNTYKKFFYRFVPNNGYIDKGTTVLTVSTPMEAVLIGYSFFGDHGRVFELNGEILESNTEHHLLPKSNKTFEYLNDNNIKYDLFEGYPEIDIKVYKINITNINRFVDIDITKKLDDLNRFVYDENNWQ